MSVSDLGEGREGIDRRIITLVRGWQRDGTHFERLSVLEFAISNTYDLERLKGKPRSFRCKIVGNKWYHSGTLSNGGTIDGEWERVEKDQ